MLLILLMISTGNYFRITAHTSVRPIVFLTIFVIGALCGVLLIQIIKAIRDKMP